MKTKIIYISGSEVFEMADVRAAFDEVRSALGLGRDTVLFGVPVDSDDALAPIADATPSDETAQAAPVVENTPIEVKAEIPTPIIQEITEPETEEPSQEEIVIDTPVAQDIAVAPIKKSRGRPRKVDVASDAQETGNTDTPAQSEKVIPILSVLAANNSMTELAPDTTTAQDTITTKTDDTPIADAEATIVADVDAGEEDTFHTESIENIDDMIADQNAPVESTEKTLEELLESMTPLREDHGEVSAIDMNDEAVPMSESVEMMMGEDTDATLEQLATEFADAADTIAAPAPAPSQGKIGKLKNILPFKKARRDDTGLMSDLFGWAGVAANDEDFTIPGFFTTAASKK